MLVKVTDSLRNSIKEERKKSKIRGDELAKDIGKSPSYISQIENGIINTIDLSILYKIIKQIVPKDKIDDFLNQFDLANNLFLTDEEKEQEQWKYNIEYQFRRFEISNEIIEFIHSKLSNLNISGKELIQEINKNATLDDETMSKLNGRENEVLVEVNDNGVITKSIIFNLSLDLIDKLINKEIESLNRITIEGILFNIFLLEGNDVNTAFNLVSKQLEVFKIFTISKRDKMIREAQAEGKDISDIPSKSDGESNLLINKINKHFVKLRDFDPVYARKVFTNFENNLKTNKNLTYAIMKLDISNLSSLNNDNKRDLLHDIEKLIDSYYEKYIKDDIIL